MTIHSAKGLEFPVVILPGFEDGIFPGMQTIVGGEEDMEEERRLAYVALTRAKQQIYILHTKSRLLYGQTQYNPISRFVSEIPETYTLVEDECEEAYFTQPINTPKVYISGGQPTKNSFGGEGYYNRGNMGYANKTPKAPAYGSSYARPASSASASQPIFKKQEGTEVFAPGDRVKHMTFGEGEVLSVRPMGSDTLYEVMFDKVGTKKLMATYAKLKKA